MKDVKVKVKKGKISVSKEKLYMEQKGRSEEIKIVIKTKGWYFPKQYNSETDAYGIKIHNNADGEFSIIDRNKSGDEVTLCDQNSNDEWYKYDITVVDDPEGSNPTTIFEDPQIKNGGPGNRKIAFLKSASKKPGLKKIGMNKK